jgi:hypothetical protein
LRNLPELLQIHLFLCRISLGPNKGPQNRTIKFINTYEDKIQSKQEASKFRKTVIYSYSFSTGLKWETLKFKKIVTSGTGLPPVRIWYGQSLYDTDSRYIRRSVRVRSVLTLKQQIVGIFSCSTCCPYKLSVFFVSKTIICCKIYQKNL